MSSKVNSIKAKHDELLGELTAYLETEDADIKVAEAKEVELKAVKAELDQALALEAKVRGHIDEAKAKGKVQPPNFLFNIGNSSKGAEPLTLGQKIVATEEFKSLKAGGLKTSFQIDLEGNLKTVLASSPLTGYDRTPGVNLQGVQRPVVADLIAEGATDQPTIRVLTEQSYTNYASPTAEGSALPEAAWSLVEDDFPVRKVGETAKVTDEMLADHPAVASYLDQRLAYGVAIREEGMLVNGSGTSPDLTGFLNTTGLQTYAKGTVTGESNADAFLNAITMIRGNAFTEPTGAVINPFDKGKLLLEKDANKQFYGMGPWTGPYGQDGPLKGVDTYWGIPFVTSTSVPQGTILVGAFRTMSQVFRRQGITIEMTNYNEADFKSNLICIRAYERLALVVYRPKAFATVTNIS